jgi:hypothetical protein
MGLGPEDPVWQRRGPQPTHQGRWGRSLTQDEEHLHGNVTDKGVSRSDGGVIITQEADIVGDGDCNVEGGEEDEAIPDSFGDAVVEEEAAGPPHRGHLVLRHRWLWLKHVLKGEGWWLGTLGEKRRQG